MVFFPLCGVLRGFSAATYNKYVSPQTPARHRERSGEAGGLVRLVELLNFHKNRCEIPHIVAWVEHINSKNQDVKSRRAALPNEKNPHL
jgi:hypothetical protein